jgi:valyl-tRNA synthetase
MDLRPQAHEIIRTWLFYSVLRAEQEEGVLPWRHAAISGWIVDPDRKKMSKSAGNVLTPTDMFDNYGTDAVRYWAASARLGVDTAFDPAQLKIGRRLAVKILNASRFVLGIGESGGSGGGSGGGLDGPVTEPIDRALLRRLAAVTAQCTDAFEAYDHALALEHAERFFWFFCDDYLELVKPRAYGERGPQPAASAVATLRQALSVMLRLLAPFVPFVTEEVWSWWQTGSVHLAGWPEPAGLLSLADADASAVDGAGAVDGAVSPGGTAVLDASTAPEGATVPGSTAVPGSAAVPGSTAAPGSAAVPGGTAVLDAAAAAIGAVRRAKSQAQLPMKAPVSQLILTAPQEQLDALAAAAPDVSAAGRVAEIKLHALPGIDPVHEVLL